LFASSMLQRFNERYSADQRITKLKSIDEAVDRMNELVEQSLSLGRAEVSAPKLEPVDVRTFVTRVADEVRSATLQRSPVKLELAEPLPRIQTDPMLLRTILSNLLDNAVKYSPAGEAVLLHVETRDEQLIITVRDHGPGLREEDMPKLFTSFYRGGNTSHISGTGLGLAIVKRCATALGGDVSARNANDGGAEFIVMLPPLPNSNLQSEI